MNVSLFHTNFLSPERYGGNFKSANLQHILKIDILSIFSEIALRLIPYDFNGDKLIVVQVMDCCHQAMTYYMSQCWPRSLLT